MSDDSQEANLPAIGRRNDLDVARASSRLLQRGLSALEESAIWLEITEIAASGSSIFIVTKNGVQRTEEKQSGEIRHYLVLHEFLHTGEYVRRMALPLVELDGAIHRRPDRGGLRVTPSCIYLRELLHPLSSDQKRFSYPEKREIPVFIDYLFSHSGAMLAVWSHQYKYNFSLMKLADPPVIYYSPTLYSFRNVWEHSIVGVTEKLIVHDVVLPWDENEDEAQLTAPMYRLVCSDIAKMITAAAAPEERMSSQLGSRGEVFPALGASATVIIDMAFPAVSSWDEDPWQETVSSSTGIWFLNQETEGLWYVDLASSRPKLTAALLPDPRELIYGIRKRQGSEWNSSDSDRSSKGWELVQSLAWQNRLMLIVKVERARGEWHDFILLLRSTGEGIVSDRVVDVAHMLKINGMHVPMSGGPTVGISSDSVSGQGSHGTTFEEFSWPDFHHRSFEDGRLISLSPDFKKVYVIHFDTETISWFRPEVPA